ncbi:LysR family transcriptional regulator, glycine cleavage system transcriptional activator [Microbulbifer donghaiensis]|uniref:LysR family transcriptional regulator, glycine cleavage system transcriptional activator n=1 Tax=Microbulbifer donghaiensis TaxID=494016 RepID=A0A1M4XWI2_9GAMM|nr:LysR substrate-binding domain-containing protein [Microbulbifer donghaiensis]SHE97602.1 LysR family transcriptional regulator, glycine cleavage system transcriptional activator [Microbulbifer donghaiensis]
MAAQLRNLSLTSLRTFHAVGRHCHMRRAADELHVSHPALSRQIRELEARLGTPLFERSGNRLALTAAGRRLHRVVSDAFTQLEKGLLYLDPESLSGEVVIATTATISLSWMLRLLREVRARYPEIRLRLTTIEPRARRLHSDIDIAICLGEPEAPERRVTALYEEHYLPVCSPQLLQQRRFGRPRDLLQLPLLHDTLQQWPSWFTSQGVDYVPGAGEVQFDYAYQAIEAARLGMGLALADRQEVGEDLKAGRLVTVIERPFTIGQSLYLACGRGPELNARSRLVLGLIFEWLSSRGAPLQAGAKDLQRELAAGGEGVIT